MYLPSNGATVNVVHRDLDLNVQGHEFFIVDIKIYQRISQTAQFRRIFNPVSGGHSTFILSPQILLPFPSFPSFQGGVENT